MQYNRNYFDIDNSSLGPAMTGRLIVATVTNISACACAIVTGCLSIVCTSPATLRRPHAVSGRTPIKKSLCKYYKLANNDRNMYDNIHWQVWVTWNDLIGHFGEKITCLISVFRTSHCCIVYRLWAIQAWNIWTDHEQSMR